LLPIARPTGSGWDCVEQSAIAPTRTTLLKCRRPAPELLFFVAKDYEVPPGAVLPVERLAREEFPGHYRAHFKHHTVARTTPVTVDGTTGFEIALDATHAQKGAIRKVERVFAKDTHVLVVSAEGTPADFARHEAARAAFFAGVKFKVLAP
jgi:hypothetical protein